MLNPVGKEGPGDSGMNAGESGRSDDKCRRVGDSEGDSGRTFSPHIQSTL